MRLHPTMPARTKRRLQRASGLIAVAAVVAVSAAGCGNTAAGGGVKDGGVFRLGSSSVIDSLNPFIAFNSDAYAAFEYIYPFLDQYNPQLKIVGDFATSWSTSANGLVWTFHTQPHAKWSDGKPLTAADAAWTINTILKFQNGPTANSSGYVAHLKSAVAPNATTLVLTYAKPVANVLAQFQQMPILPQHIWAKYAAGNGKALKTFTNVAPIVGGGPFTLVRYMPKEADFKRNPDFYGPKPHIFGIVLQFFGTNDAMITALKSGQLDGVETVTPTSVATVKAAHFVMPDSPGVLFDEMIINSNPKQDASHRELLNPLLRQAFDAAIDREAIVKTSLLGFGTQGSSIVPPATGHWYDPAIKSPPFSLATANKLLDQAGYKMGPNNVRMANGHPMSYTVIMASSIAAGYGQRSFAIVQADFAKIGVHLTLKVLDDSAANSAILANGYKTYELSMWDWQPLADPDFILSVLTCGSWYVWSDTGYCSKAYDNLYAAQSAAIKPAQRQAIVYQMQQMIATAKPYLVIDYPDNIEAHSPKWKDLPLVEGVSWVSLSKIPFETVHLAG